MDRAEVSVYDSPPMSAPIEDWIAFRDQLAEAGEPFDDYVWPVGFDPETAKGN